MMGSPDALDPPSGGVRLDDRPVEIVVGIDVPWSVVLGGEENLVS